MDVGPDCTVLTQPRRSPPHPVFLTRRILLIAAVESVLAPELQVGSQPPREKCISLPALNLVLWSSVCGLWSVSGGTPKSLAETPMVAHKLFVDQEAKRGGILLSLLMPVVYWRLN